MGTAQSSCRRIDKGATTALPLCSAPVATSTSISISGDPTTSSSSVGTRPLFPQFNFLSDDLVLEVLSFVASAPFEPAAGGGDHESSIDAVAPLTHVLPLVCRRFRDLCNSSDSLWMTSLERLVTRGERGRWDGGLSALAAGGGGDDAAGTLSEGTTYSSLTADDEVRAYLSAVCEGVGRRMGKGGEVGKEEETRIDAAAKKPRLKQRLQITWPKRRDKVEQDTLSSSSVVSPVRATYSSLIRDHMVISLPIFYMPSNNIRLFRMIGLHFFEPRYCLLIREATAGRKARELRGSGLMLKPRPRFVFAASSQTEPLGPGSSAFLVEVHRVRMFPSGRADILVMPVKRICLKAVRERPGSHGLRDAYFRPPTA